MQPIRFSNGYDAAAQNLIEGRVRDSQAQTARAEVSSIVKAYIERNGVRRFEAGTSGDYQSLKAFLAERGFILTTYGRSTTFIIKVPGQRGRAKAMNWSKVIEFVDELRMGEGLEPLKRRAAA
jgi:hypothetical protein